MEKYDIKLLIGAIMNNAWITVGIRGPFYHPLSVFKYQRACACVFVHSYINVYACHYACMYASILVCVCVCVCIVIYIYIYIYVSIYVYRGLYV